MLYFERQIHRRDSLRAAKGKNAESFIEGIVLFIGSCIGVYMVGNPGCFVGEADVGFACAGLLAGWFIGMVHGGIVLWRKRRRNA